MKKIVILFSILFLVSFLFLPGLAHAECEGLSGDDLTDCKATAANKNIDGAAPVSLGNPLGNATPQSLMGRIIDAILGIIGSLALLMFIFGGITWMTSAGSPEKIKKGRDILVWTSIGLAIVFFSYAIVKFVIFDIIGG